MSPAVTGAASGRARLGQVFTPPAVADLALALALDGAPREPRLLDPAAGDGAFLAAAVRAGISPGRLVGVELDPRAYAAARARLPRGVTLEQGDFLDEAAPAEGELYDVVVTNPPWVRQELLSGDDKERVARRLAADWPGVPALPRRADLAAAFVLRALRFVRPGGRVALVLSAAALESDWGGRLRELLGGRAHVVAVVSSPSERWFADAAVHGVIVVLERVLPGVRDGRAPTRAPTRARTLLAQLSGPIGEAAGRVRAVADLAAVAAVRTLDDAAPWRGLVAGTDAWLELARAAGDALVPLGAIALVRRGLTTGANEFFYLSRADATARAIEPELLSPVLRSPRELTGARVAAREVGTLAFTAPPDAALLARRPHAAAWVRAHAALATRPTLASRSHWWSLAAAPARLFLTKAYDARFVQPLADEPMLCDQRFYAVEPIDGDHELLAAVLNGSITALALEALGRQSMGEGALEWSVADAARLPVIDPRRVDRARLLAAFAAVSRRPMGELFAERDAPDRRVLDLALCAALPAAARGYGEAAAAAVATLAAARRARAVLPGVSPPRAGTRRA